MSKLIHLFVLILFDFCRFTSALTQHLNCLQFLRAKAALLSARLSHRNSVRPSVCHTGGSGKNGASYDHQIFTVGRPEDSSFRNRKAFP